MPDLDLTPFGFTPTESKVYQVLVTAGPGTGYAIARSAGLARANAYSALEGLVAKGAARADAGRPRRYRPEVPGALVARLTGQQARALDDLHDALAGITAPVSPALVEVESARALYQLLGREIARATGSVALLAPADAYAQFIPSLRKAAGAGVALRLLSVGAVDLPFATVAVVTPGEDRWPGEPIVAEFDRRSAVLASRQGQSVTGHWGAAPTFVAAARMTLERWQTA